MLLELEQKIKKKLDLSILDIQSDNKRTAIEILEIAGFVTKDDIVRFIKDLYYIIYSELEDIYSFTSFNDMFDIELSFLEIKNIVHTYIHEHIIYGSNVIDEDLIKKELELSLVYIFITLILHFHNT